MTLTDLLDDLAGSEPVGRPDLARRAWEQGRRDRSHRRLGGGLAAAAVLAVLALVAPAVAVPGAGPSFARPDAVVQGHPERVGWQPWVRGLPDRPGPVAALLETVVHEETHDEPGSWQAVAADGHRWRLPSTASTWHVPVLSPDGRRAGWLLGDDGPFVVQDLVTGERTRWEQVGALGTSADPGLPFQQHVQSPSWFSPDGSLLLLGGGPRDGRAGERLLLSVRDGGLTVLPPDLGNPAGWAGDGRLVWLRGSGTGASQGVRAVTTDLRGRVLASVPLPGAQQPDQWSGTVSSDGSSLAVVSDGSFGQRAGVRRYDLATGRPLPGLAPVEPQSCGTAWAGGGDGRLVVQTSRDDVLTAAAVLPDRTEAVTTVTARASGRCLLWATDALLGPAQEGALPGARWWREALLAGLLLGGLALGGVRLRARGAAPRPGD